MDENKILTQLLGIKQLEVTGSTFEGSEIIHLKVESLLKVAACPDCGKISLREHERGDEQQIRDLAVAERRCWLLYHPRRFHCDGCQKTFVERVEWRRAGMGYTTRYERYIYQRSRREPISQVAQDEGLSEEAVQAIFEDWAKKTIAAQGYPRVKVVCFDEITLHKGHGKYILVISAPELGMVLDVLADRSKEKLLAWLEERGQAWREGVEVACSDMWDAYQEAVAEKLPNARRVVDRFHVMKNLNEALTKARRVIQQDADEISKTLLKGCRWLLVKNRENLTAEEQEKLTHMLAASPELCACYTLKEDFRTLFNQPLNEKEAEKQLEDWVKKVPVKRTY